MSNSENTNSKNGGLNTRNIHVKHFLQSHGLCGPASLKILLSHFGKDFSEAQLAQLAHATGSLERGQGTEHEGMVEAIKAIDGHVFSKEEGTLEELQYFVNKEQLPVIIGWFDRTEDHYSVVVSVTEKNIIIVDPSMNEPERWLDRAVFSKIWFDFVGKEDKVASWGWYMVVTFEKRKFDIKGGHYY